MNYDEFRAWRDEVVAQHPTLRLDCMNPTKALDHMARPVHANSSASLADLVAQWHNVLGRNVDRQRLVPGTGVRDILRALFTALASSQRTFWLPGDVYPVYRQLAGPNRVQEFATFPVLDWRFLAETGTHDCLLLPAPLSPTGRRLAPRELDRLTTWIDDSPRRQLILDGVYNYSFPIHEDRLRTLIAHEQCLAVYSTSKSWLLPQVAGIASVPQSIRDQVIEQVTLPTDAQQESALLRLSSDADLPARLQLRFAMQWRKLQPRLQRIAPTWQPPQTGYFGTLPVDAKSLWQNHQIVVVPASVFGSHVTNMSVITCLFDIKADDLSRQKDHARTRLS